jgi:hypothetical protein
MSPNPHSPDDAERELCQRCGVALPEDGVCVACGPKRLDSLMHPCITVARKGHDMNEAKDARRDVVREVTARFPVSPHAAESLGRLFDELLSIRGKAPTADELVDFLTPEQRP